MSTVFTKAEAGHCSLAPISPEVIYRHRVLDINKLSITLTLYAPKTVICSQTNFSLSSMIVILHLNACWKLNGTVHANRSY